MYLYLMRHGEYKSKDEDPEQGLSDQGAAAVKKTAVFFKQFHSNVDTILHSEKKRAQQTAEIFAEVMALPSGPRLGHGLAPNDDASIIIAELSRLESSSVMIVGHLPHLSKLTSQLLTGNPDHKLIELAAAAILCLSGGPKQWVIEWMIAPHLILG